MLYNTVCFQDQYRRSFFHTGVTYHLRRVWHSLSIYVRVKVQQVVARQGHGRYYRVGSLVRALRHDTRAIQVPRVPNGGFGLIGFFL